MLWQRRDMGSDPIHPIFVITDIPTINDEFVQVNIPIAAYKRLVDWCSLGRTLDNCISMLAESENEQAKLAYDELRLLDRSLRDIHNAIRQHYIELPLKEISK